MSTYIKYIFNIKMIKPVEKIRPLLYAVSQQTEHSLSAYYFDNCYRKDFEILIRERKLKVFHIILLFSKESIFKVIIINVTCSVTPVHFQIFHFIPRKVSFQRSQGSFTLK